MNDPAAEHRQERREHARAEHVGHSATSASRSMPAEREPLSSTTSPGRSTRGSSSAAAATSAAPVPLAAVGGRRSRPRELAHADHDVDAEPRARVADLGVPARRVRPELGHVAEHGDGARARRRARRARRARSRSRPDSRCRRRSRARRRRARACSWPRSGESSIAAGARAEPLRAAARRGRRPPPRRRDWRRGAAARSGTVSSPRSPSTSSTRARARVAGLPGEAADVAAGSPNVVVRTSRAPVGLEQRLVGRQHGVAARRQRAQAARPPRARRPRGRPRNSRCSGATFVITPISGSAIAASSAELADLARAELADAERVLAARAGRASTAGRGGCCGCDGWRVSARAGRRARRACPSWTSCHSIRRCRSPSRPMHAAPAARSRRAP